METDLVVRARSGDQGAFALIVATIASRFHGVAYAILRERTLAEDAAQAAMVAIWRDLPRLRDSRRFDAWAHRILVNACYHEGRRARWRGVEFGEALAEPATTDDELHAVLDRDEIERGFRQLSVEHRAALVAHYYLDLPSDEAADMLGIPVGTFKSRLHRASEAMRAVLEAEARPMAFETSRQGGTR